MTALARRLKRGWESASLSDLAWLIGCGLLFWASKWTGKLFEGTPGHAGAFWIPTLFLARAALGRPGAATMAALMGASFWCFPRGGGMGGLAPYVAAGLALDLMDRNGDRLRRLPIALLAGALCHLVKFGFHNVPAAVLGLRATFLAWGFWPVAALHLLFGLAGGFTGWLCLRAADRWSEK
jgi:hypothetical protein